MSIGELSRTRLNRMHDVMARHVEAGRAPGLITLVSRRGEVHVDAVGTRTLGGRDPVRRDSIFRIASMTEPVTAVAALILVEECRLRLDDPVDRFLPELADRRVLRRLDGPLDDTEVADRPLTVRDLLTFRMGFGTVPAPPDSTPIQRAISEHRLAIDPPRPSVVPAPDTWIRDLGSLPLMHQPGRRWMHGTGSDVLGVLIARASGQTFDSFLRERIFGPLGMIDTGFSVPNSKRDRFTTSYVVNGGTGALEPYDAAAVGEWNRPPAFPSGAVGLVSTIDDYLAFGQMMLNHGKHGRQRVLSRPSIEAMTTDQLTSEQKARSGPGAGAFDGQGWGFGVTMATRRTDPSQPVGSFGSDGGFGTSWRTDPRESMVSILMSQAAWPPPNLSPPCLDFRTLVYQAIDD
jgi:CubicO group peptidase (beta-lactamase class C family)